MNMRNSMRRLLCLLCCAAMLLPCVPAVAAEETLIDDGFESYADQAALTAVWTKQGTTVAGRPELSTERAAGGKQSMLLNDEEGENSLQARYKTAATTYPAGTELILSTKYYMESKAGSGAMPSIGLYTSGGNSTVRVYSTGKWDDLSVIRSTAKDKEAVAVLFASNAATIAKVFFDDVKLQVLTEELALEHIDEKILSPEAEDITAALTSKALSLSGVDASKAADYLAVMREIRAEKGAALTRAEVQNCIYIEKMNTLAASLKGDTLAVGNAGSIAIPVTTMPQGVSARWVSVAPAGKNVTVGDKALTVAAVPSGATEEYTAVLRLSAGDKSVDVEYTLQLMNTDSFNEEELAEVARNLATNALMGVTSRGTVATPKISVQGVSAQWSQIKRYTGDRLTLSNGTLTVNSLPTGLDYDEAVVTLKLAKGSASVEMDYTIIVYDNAHHVLVNVPNNSFEVVGGELAEGWLKSTADTAMIKTERVTGVARTGSNSVHLVDGDITTTAGVRVSPGLIPAKAGYDYVAEAWFKGEATASTADRAGAALYIEDWTTTSKRGATHATPGVPINNNEWTKLSIRGKVSGAYVGMLGYSYQATISDMYVDDFLLWEITPAGILAEIDEVLTASKDVDLLYTRLGSGTLKVTGLNTANKQAYLTALTARRTSKGSALNGTELAEVVKSVNEGIATDDKALVTKLAEEVATVQSLNREGLVPLPQVGDNTVTLKWTKVTGDTNKRIQIDGSSAMLTSLPAFGQKDETVQMTLTITKGSAKATAVVKTTLKASTKSTNDMIAAADALDIDEYLNGQKANHITGDILPLPTSLTGGVAVKWETLDSGTLQATTAVTARGKVTRPAYGQFDAAVVLRATLTKGGESYQRDFYVIVCAMGADEARDVVTENVDFEMAAPADKYTAPTGWNKRLKWEDGPNEILTSYANIDTSKAFTGTQSLRLTASGTMASVQNEHVFSVQEGRVYTLEVMAYTDSAEANPSVSIKFWDNEGEELSAKKVTYASAPGDRNVWKNLSITTVAPVGALMVTAELDGGTKKAVTYFDDVRLREYPVVANGAFELGDQGWTTEGTVSGGKLTLTAGQTAESMVRPAERGVAYFLSLDTEGQGKAALRFVDKSGKTLAEYTRDMKTGLNAFFAYAPTDTAGVQVVLTGAMTADNVKITRSVGGTVVADGDFELSAKGDAGTPWDLTNATIDTNTGKTGAGLTVKSGGKALSAIIPTIDGKNYTVTADVKGQGGVMEIGLYTIGTTGSLMSKYTVTSAGDDWNTISYTINGVPEPEENAQIEHSYIRVILSGDAVFDNVKVYSINKTASNPSMENINRAISGTFPYHWTGYGTAATYSTNQVGQFTEGTKGLAVELFGLGQGGVRSGMVQDVKGGKAYEATINAKGSGVKLSLEFWDTDFNKLGSESATINSADWKEYSIKVTAPAGSIYASLSVGGEGSALVYLDEATLYPVVRSIGTDVQLFIDNWLIKDSANVKRTLHQGEAMDKMASGWFPHMLWNPDKQVYEIFQTGSPDYAMYYRTSPDGINWSDRTMCECPNKPKPYNFGATINVLRDEDEPDPSKRYKGIFFESGSNGTVSRYVYGTSADGIIWTYHDTVLTGWDVVNVIYDEANDEYVATYKRSRSAPSLKRMHRVAVSKDLINWSEGVRMYNIGAQQDTGDDFLRIDSYTVSTLPIGDSYVGSDYRFTIDDADNYGGPIDNVLYFSRDLTEDWQRIYDENGEPFVLVPLGKEGEWDDAQLYLDKPIQMGDETWWFYSGWSGEHGVVGVPKSGGWSAAKWRRNGFASMDFSAGGTLTTQQFTLMGTELHLNAVGDLTVELLDASGAVVATGKFSGDHVDGIVTWDKSIAGQAGKVVSLRITGSDAQLYSIQWTGSIFGDVAEDAWYSRAVNYAVDNGIMGGYGGGKFGPNDNLSRAMVVQMLYNKVGQPAISGKHGFADVPADQWFNNAVTWGTKNGVMGGYGDGKFGPNDNVTIEQIAVILWNYSGNPEFDAELGGVGSYSGWASNALTWATDNGILHGVNFKNATDNATRAQAAQMLTNYLRW